MGVFYRKSLFDEKVYQVPKTLDDLKALGAKMKKDGLTPIAFADKDGWPAMGTFDILNMRINGYDFHISLMAGKESWTDPKVEKVFDTWRGLLPLPPGRARWAAPGRRRRRACVNKKAGMYLLGMFVGQQFTGAAARRPGLLRVPGVRLRTSARTRWTRRSTASWSPRPEERGRRQRAAGVPRRPAARRTST